jgi:hypothetical protein
MIAGLATDEEQLAEVLKPFGEMVVIGRPGEGLPRPGAAALYSSHDEWQSLVTDRMSTARLVLIRPGDGAGVLWELGRAREIVSPEKLLIVINANTDRKYQQIRQKVGKAGIEVPADIPWRWPGGRRGFVLFSCDWTPKFLPLSGPILRRGVYKPYRGMARYALRPVFEQNGLPWVSPPISAWAVVIVGIPCLFLSLLVLVIVLVTLL